MLIRIWHCLNHPVSEGTLVRGCPQVLELDSRTRDTLRREVEERLVLPLLPAMVFASCILAGLVVWLQARLWKWWPSGTIYQVVHVFVIAGATLGMGAGARYLLMRFVFSHRVARYAREALNKRGGPLVCERCGYDLRGVGSERCPECGSQSSSSKARE